MGKSVQRYVRAKVGGVRYHRLRLQRRLDQRHVHRYQFHPQRWNCSTQPTQPKTIPQVYPIAGGGQLITVGFVQPLYTTKLAKVITTDGKIWRNINTTNLQYLPSMPWRIHEKAKGTTIVLWNPALCSTFDNKDLLDSRWARVALRT